MAQLDQFPAGGEANLVPTCIVISEGQLPTATLKPLQHCQLARLRSSRTGQHCGYSKRAKKPKKDPHGQVIPHLLK